MKILYNRTIAVIVLVLCILGTILLGGGRSLRAARGECAGYFYEGTDDDGSIADDLHARTEAGYNLVTVALRYMDEDAEAIREMRRTLEALESADSAEEAGKANAALTFAADELFAAMKEEELSEHDRGLAESQLAEMTSRSLTISHNGYNDRAEEFNTLLDTFPTSVIAGLGGIRPLELFR